MGKHRKPYLDAEGVLVKVCNSCGKPRALTEFNKHSSTNDCLRADCKDCVNARSRAWRELNPDRAIGHSRQNNAKARETPRGRLDNNMRTGIWMFLKGLAPSKPTFQNLEFSGDELRSHIETQFIGHMSWTNYGRYGWHVDHRIPLKAFDYTSPSDASFKEAWQLSNLHPLWWHENLWKGARYEAANDNVRLNARGINVAA